jgi:putative transcriptional regulator
MPKLPKTPARKSRQTGVKKLRTKSEILEALDAMPFDGADLVSAASRLAEALQGPGKATLRRVSVPVPSPVEPAQIVSLRQRLKMSQAVFAGFLGVRPASVMSWEYGRRSPSGPALRLLEIASRHPEVLLEVA